VEKGERKPNERFVRSLKYILAMGGNVQVSVKHRSWLIGMMSARTTIRIGRDREVSVKLVLRYRREKRYQSLSYPQVRDSLMFKR
jgi:hypothetical protein